MSGVVTPENLRRRPVREERAEGNASPESGEREAAKKDPFVMEGEAEVEDEWGLDDEDWQPGEKEKEETPADRRVQR